MLKKILGNLFFLIQLITFIKSTDQSKTDAKTEETSEEKVEEKSDTTVTDPASSTLKVTLSDPQLTNLSDNILQYTTFKIKDKIYFVSMVFHLDNTNINTSTTTTPVTKTLTTPLTSKFDQLIPMGTLVTYFREIKDADKEKDILEALDKSDMDKVKSTMSKGFKGKCKEFDDVKVQLKVLFQDSKYSLQFYSDKTTDDGDEYYDQKQFDKDMSLEGAENINEGGSEITVEPEFKNKVFNLVVNKDNKVEMKLLAKELDQSDCIKYIQKNDHTVVYVIIGCVAGAVFLLSVLACLCFL